MRWARRILVIIKVMNDMNYNPTTVQVAEEKSTTVEAERKSKDKNN